MNNNAIVPILVFSTYICPNNTMHILKKSNFLLCTTLLENKYAITNGVKTAQSTIRIYPFFCASASPLIFNSINPK